MRREVGLTPGTVSLAPVGLNGRHFVVEPRGLCEILDSTAAVHRDQSASLLSNSRHTLHTLLDFFEKDGYPSLYATREGLSRHDAIHAIGSVLVEHFSEAVSENNKGDASTLQSRYDAAVERITAEEWYRQFGPSRDDG